MFNPWIGILNRLYVLFQERHCVIRVLWPKMFAEEEGVTAVIALINNAKYFCGMLHHIVC